MLDLAHKQDFDAVVVCSSIPLYLRENIVRELKRLRPTLPLIVICEEGERDCFHGLATEVVYAPEKGPQQPVIDAIRLVVGRQRSDQKKIV